MAPLEERFAVAAANARALPPPGRVKLLELYGLYKQSREGDAPQKRPGITNMRGRAKHDAWGALRGLGPRRNDCSVANGSGSASDVSTTTATE
ncbi:MAG: acyl-CoA-binding protein [Candidatus Poseidoniia archaeon]|nr:acyl-CoA-binding protein [Candidatus Poseidoniia archaeon]